jgi:DNA-binding protein YbaB
LPESIERRLEAAMAELEATQAAVAKAEEELRQASYTERSHDRAVEVTVGAQGELTDLRFLDGKYRNMGAAELSASILQAAQQARSRMARQVMETFKPFTQPVITEPELTGVNIDWAKIFGPDILEDPQDQETPRRRRSSRLRDEISEDGEDGNG